MPDTTANQIFTPPEGDYSIAMLKSMLGNVVNTLLGSGGGTDGAGATMITTVIASINLAILFFAGVVATYTIYMAVMDTSRDGEVFGSQTNTHSTAIRAALGAAALLPLKSGLTLVQIVVLQIVVWGCGAATFAWTRVADKMFTNDVGLTSASSPDKAYNFVIKGKMARVMRTRLNGYVCQLYANQISKTLGSEGSLKEKHEAFDVSLENALNEDYYSPNGAYRMYFSSGQDYNNVSSMCGMVTIQYARPDESVLNSKFTSSSANYTSKLDTIIQNAMNSAIPAAGSALDSAAKSIAEDIVNNGNRNVESIKERIKQAVDSASSNYHSSFSSSMGTANSEASTLSNSYREATLKNGWVFASIWQRSLSSFNRKITSAQNSFEVISNDTFNPGKAGSLLWSSSAEKAVLENATVTMGQFMPQFDGLFSDLQSPVSIAGVTSSEELLASNRSASGFAPLQWLYGSMLNRLTPKTSSDSNGWSDPILDIQDQGHYFIMAGGGMTAISAGTDFFSKKSGAGLIASPVLDGFSSVLWTLGSFFLLAGFLAGSVLPFAPFAYFISGVISWVLMALEALVAAPLWCLLFLTPSKDHDLIGTNRQGMMLLIAVLLRPILMILGLVAAYVIMRIGLDFLFAMFQGLFVIMTPDWSLTNIFTTVGLLVVYLIMISLLVLHCSSLTTVLGDQVMIWIDARVSGLGSNNLADAVGNPAASIRGGAESMGGRIGHNFRQRRARSTSEASSEAGREKVKKTTIRFRKFFGKS